MKSLRVLLCLLAAFVLAVPAAFGDSSAEPVITAIHGKKVSVTVPPGFDSVTLQALKKKKRVRGQPRVEQWRTVETKFPRGEAATYTFRLGKLTPKRNLRAFGRTAETLPKAFFNGLTNFAADPPELRIANGTAALGVAINREAFGPIDLFATAAVSSSDASTREVVESDIWKLAGDRLYFFNQLRGLQVFDVKDPDQPALLGTLRMPAVGEDMVLLGENHAVLLKRDWSLWNDWWWDDFLPILGGGVITFAADTALVSSARAVVATTQEATRSNEVVIVDVATGRPTALARLPFAGSLIESRLVGSVLYVAASINRQLEELRGFEYGTEITAFDLSDPAHPVRRDSIFVPGWTNVVSATNRFFMIAGSNSNGLGSGVELIDIGSPDGTMRRSGRAAVEGWIADKFKLDLAGDVLTTVSSSFTNPGGSWRSVPVTVLQTFSIANPDAPVALGRVEIAPGESVRATRFDDGLAYVVTFLQIDPLFVIDLRDPAAPTISGHIEVPGFSTYIEPLGDRLVTIGLLNGKPAVSLFDVSDPKNPALLTQLELAGKGWSSSEAVWDEKAFNVLPEQNLILLPIERSGFGISDAFGGRWFHEVQLIDLRRDSVVPRGVIEHGFSPRRATVKDERIISISPTRLVVADAADRDAPVVTADLEIAWRVDRVFHSGDYLVQLGSSADWSIASPQTISVARASEPDDTLAVETLPDFPVVGSAVQNDVLYVAQRAWSQREVREAAEPTDDQSRLRVSAYDLSALPKIRFLSQATAKVSVPLWAQLEALWPSPGTLVWAVDGAWRWWSRPLAGDAAATGSSESIGGTSKRFIAFDVSAPEKIRFGSEIEVGGNRPLIFSRAFASEGLVYVSAKQLGSGWVLSGDGDPAPGNDRRSDRNFLRVIEYSDPAMPYLRPQVVMLPGALRGVARGGKILYTAGQGYDLKTAAPNPDEVVLHASAFDGEAAHLLGTFPLGAFDSPVVLAGDRVFTLDEEPAYLWSYEPRDPITLDAPAVAANSLRIFWPGNRTPNPRHSRLHELGLRDDGELRERSSLELDHDHGLHLFGDLVVTAPGTQDLRLIDATDADALDDLGVASFDGWVWPILDGADGSLSDGLWVPVGNYGVEQVSWDDPPAGNP